MAAHSVEHAVVAKLRELPAEKQRDVLDFVSSLGAPAASSPPKMKSARGLWKGLGITISDEDIAEARREMWGNFPRTTARIP